MIHFSLSRRMLLTNDSFHAYYSTSLMLLMTLDTTLTRLSVLLLASSRMSRMRPIKKDCTGMSIRRTATESLLTLEGLIYL